MNFIYEFLYDRNIKLRYYSNVTLHERRNYIHLCLNFFKWIFLLKTKYK